MELTHSQDNGCPVITIKGKCTVEHAASFREALLEGARAQTNLLLDLSEVEEVDITFLQLLLSTVLTLDRDGHTLVRRGPVSEPVKQAARVSGFDTTPKLKPFFADEERDG